MANQRNILTGDVSIVEDEAVSISIERYNELIKKEAFYDELTITHDTVVTLRERLKLKEDNN